MIVKATLEIIMLRLRHMHSSEGQTGQGSFKGLTSSGRTPQKKYKSREDYQAGKHTDRADEAG